MINCWEVYYFVYSFLYIKYSLGKLMQIKLKILFVQEICYYQFAIKNIDFTKLFVKEQFIWPSLENDALSQ